MTTSDTTRVRDVDVPACLHLEARARPFGRAHVEIEVRTRDGGCRVVMREGQTLRAGHFRKLHGLIEAAVSPSAPFLQFLGRVLRVVD